MVKSADPVEFNFILLTCKKAKPEAPLLKDTNDKPLALMGFLEQIRDSQLQKGRVHEHIRSTIRPKVDKDLPNHTHSHNTYRCTLTIARTTPTLIPDTYHLHPLSAPTIYTYSLYPTYTYHIYLLSMLTAHKCSLASVV